jgi:hypothetical protein
MKDEYVYKIYNFSTNLEKEYSLCTYSSLIMCANHYLSAYYIRSVLILYSLNSYTDLSLNCRNRVEIMTDIDRYQSWLDTDTWWRDQTSFIGPIIPCWWSDAIGNTSYNRLSGHNCTNAHLSWHNLYPYSPFIVCFIRYILFAYSSSMLCANEYIFYQ